MARPDPFRFIGRVFQFRSVRPAIDREVDEEIGYHLERAEQELVERGLQREHARAEAQRRFGDLERYRSGLKRLNDRRGRIARFAAFIRDSRDLLTGAVRALRSAPVTSATVMVTLALGIGANATMFGIVDRLLLSPPPHIVEPDRVVRIYVQRVFIDRTIVTDTFSYPDIIDWQGADAFNGAAAFRNARITVGVGDGAERVNGVRAAPGFFGLLGVRPQLGRFYTDAEDVGGNAAVAVLGYDYWRRRFGGDPGVIGRRVEMGGVPHEIVGVAPRGFTGVDLQRVDVWVPLRAPANRNDPSMWGSRAWYFLKAIARLAPGASHGQAESEATALHLAGRQVDQTDSDYYDSSYDPDAKVLLGSLIAARRPRQAAERLGEADIAGWLSGVSAIVLLIACANVANILMAVGSTRRREIGVRLALGISTRRLTASLLLESSLLGIVGGGLALLLARFGSAGVQAILLPTVHWPRTIVDTRVLVFTALVATVTGVAVGLLPALHASRVDVTRVLTGGARDGVRQPSRTRTAMLVAQIAMTVMLLAGAGLLVRSLARVRAIDLGFEPDGLYLLSPEIDDSMLAPLERGDLFERALARLRELPMLSSVSSAVSAPFHSSISVDLNVPDTAEPPVFSTGGPYVIAVGPDYLRTLGIRILEGRGLDAGDVAGAPPVAVVGEVMARAYWPGRSALGHCLQIGGTEEPCTTVVGVAATTAQQALLPEDNAQYYVPLAQHSPRHRWWSPDVLLVRSADADGEHLVDLVAREVRAVDERVRFVAVRPYRELIDPQARSWELGASLFSVFGLLALAIAAVGLYAVLAFNVAQRTHEMGVRAALGAAPRRVVGLVVGQAGRLAAVSVSIGLAGTVTVSRWLEPLLYGVSPRDPLVLGVVAIVLLSVALAAAAFPASRAARVDPVRALRSD